MTSETTDPGSASTPASEGGVSEGGDDGRGPTHPRPQDLYYSDPQMGFCYIGPLDDDFQTRLPASVAPGLVALGALIAVGLAMLAFEKDMDLVAYALVAVGGLGAVALIAWGPLREGRPDAGPPPPSQ